MANILLGYCNGWKLHHGTQNQRFPINNRKTSISLGVVVCIMFLLLFPCSGTQWLARDFQLRPLVSMNLLLSLPTQGWSISQARAKAPVFPFHLLTYQILQNYLLWQADLKSRTNAICLNACQECPEALNQLCNTFRGLLIQDADGYRTVLTNLQNTKKEKDRKCYFVER